jgi:rRNA biogenesis protein RRP5
LRRNDPEGAAKVLERGLKSLSPHKHVFVISRFAQDEYAFGSVERGRTVFEELLSSNAKRLDLWNVYIDKEIKAGEVEGARTQFRRLATMSLGAKATKGVFKKWLGFEKLHGDAAQQQAVKDQARAYVARQLEEGGGGGS